MRTKTDNLFRSSFACNHDVIILTETWLNDSFSSLELFNPQYTVFRKDRNYAELNIQRGGGVLIATTNRLTSAVILTPIVNEYEDLWIQLHTANGVKLIIGCVYLPPNSSLDRYESFSTTCERLRNNYENHKFLIYGDFNLPSVRWIEEDGCMVPIELQSSSAEITFDTMYFLQLQQVNCITNSLGRTLDLFFVDDFNQPFVSESPFPLVPVDSFHPATETLLNLEHKETFSNRDTFRVYQFHRANFTDLNRCLDQMDWSFISEIANIDSMICCFYEVLYDAINQFVPTKVVMTDKYPKWFDKELRKCIAQKNKLYNKYKRSRLISDYEAYSNVRREVRVQTDMCYLLYVTNTEHLIPQNIKHFWTFINSLKKDSNMPSHMKYQDRNLDGSVDIAEAFASHFQSSYSDLSDVDLSAMEPVKYATTLSSHVFNMYEIVEKLSALDTAKKAGPDGIPAVLLKNCSPSLALPLQLLFQRSLDSGYFPKEWKRSSLLPIFKSGDKSDIANYRGISILSAIPKLFESILTDEIFATFKNNIIPEQHGFFQGRSTATNLVLYQSFLISSLEAGQQVDCIYTDLSKAFDSVCHPLLIKKLSEIGFSGSYLSWIRSYLDNRRQSVEVCGKTSREVLVTSGVPQGSHIGPMLFLLFINDVTTCFKYSKVLMYADDLKFYNVVDASSNGLQSDLDNFVSWSSCNLLNINVSKCKSISFYRLKDPTATTYTIQNDSIEAVNSINDLGVIFDRQLSFSLHVESIVLKAFRLLGFIKRNTKYINDTKAIMCLYNCLVRSILEYCSVVWAPSYAVHRNRLERVQNKFCKYLLYKHRFPCSDLTHEVRLMLCGIKSLEQRRKDALFMFIYKLFTNRIDCSSLLGQISLLVPLRLTRQQQLFHEAYHRTNYGQSACIDRLARNYNVFYSDCDIFSSSLTGIKSLILFK